MKHVRLLEFALWRLARRPWKNLALFSIYVVIVFLAASYLLYSAGLLLEVRETLGNGADLVVQARMGGGPFLFRLDLGSG